MDVARYIEENRDIKDRLQHILDLTYVDPFPLKTKLDRLDKAVAEAVNVEPPEDATIVAYQQLGIMEVDSLNDSHNFSHQHNQDEEHEVYQIKREADSGGTSPDLTDEVHLLRTERDHWKVQYYTAKAQTASLLTRKHRTEQLSEAQQGEATQPEEEEEEDLLYSDLLEEMQAAQKRAEKESEKLADSPTCADPVTKAATNPVSELMAAQLDEFAMILEELKCIGDVRERERYLLKFLHQKNEALIGLLKREEALSRHNERTITRLRKLVAQKDKDIHRLQGELQRINLLDLDGRTRFHLASVNSAVAGAMRKGSKTYVGGRPIPLLTRYDSMRDYPSIEDSPKSREESSEDELRGIGQDKNAKRDGSAAGDQHDQQDETKTEFLKIRMQVLSKLVTELREEAHKYKEESSQKQERIEAQDAKICELTVEVQEQARQIKKERINIDRFNELRTQALVLRKVLVAFKKMIQERFLRPIREDTLLLRRAIFQYERYCNAVESSTTRFYAVHERTLQDILQKAESRRGSRVSDADEEEEHPEKAKARERTASVMLSENQRTIPSINEVILQGDNRLTRLTNALQQLYTKCKRYGILFDHDDTSGGADDNSRSPRTPDETRYVRKLKNSDVRVLIEALEMYLGEVPDQQGAHEVINKLQELQKEENLVNFKRMMSHMKLTKIQGAIQQERQRHKKYGRSKSIRRQGSFNRLTRTRSDYSTPDGNYLEADSHSGSSEDSVTEVLVDKHHRKLSTISSHSGSDYSFGDAKYRRKSAVGGRRRKSVHTGFASSPSGKHLTDTKMSHHHQGHHHGHQGHHRERMKSFSAPRAITPVPPSEREGRGSTPTLDKVDSLLLGLSPVDTPNTENMIVVTPSAEDGKYHTVRTTHDFAGGPSNYTTMIPAALSTESLTTEPGEHASTNSRPQSSARGVKRHASMVTDPIPEPVTVSRGTNPLVAGIDKAVTLQEQPPFTKGEPMTPSAQEQQDLLQKKWVRVLVRMKREICNRAIRTTEHKTEPPQENGVPLDQLIHQLETALDNFKPLVKVRAVANPQNAATVSGSSRAAVQCLDQDPSTVFTDDEADDEIWHQYIDDYDPFSEPKPKMVDVAIQVVTRKVGFGDSQIMEYTLDDESNTPEPTFPPSPLPVSVHQRQVQDRTVDTSHTSGAKQSSLPSTPSSRSNNDTVFAATAAVHSPTSLCSTHATATTSATAATTTVNHEGTTSQPSSTSDSNVNNTQSDTTSNIQQSSSNDHSTDETTATLAAISSRQSSVTLNPQTQQVISHLNEVAEQLTAVQQIQDQLTELESSDDDEKQHTHKTKHQQQRGEVELSTSSPMKVKDTKTSRPAKGIKITSRRTSSGKSVSSLGRQPQKGQYSAIRTIEVTEDSVKHSITKFMGLVTYISEVSAYHSNVTTKETTLQMVKESGFTSSSASRTATTTTATGTTNSLTGGTATRTPTPPEGGTSGITKKGSQKLPASTGGKPKVQKASASIYRTPSALTQQRLHNTKQEEQTAPQPPAWLKEALQNNPTDGSTSPVNLTAVVEDLRAQIEQQIETLQQEEDSVEEEGGPTVPTSKVPQAATEGGDTEMPIECETGPSLGLAVNFLSSTDGTNRCVVEKVEASVQTTDIKPNDVLEKWNGTTVDSQQALQKALETVQVGDTVKLTVRRRGTQITLPWTIEQGVKTSNQINRTQLDTATATHHSNHNSRASTSTSTTSTGTAKKKQLKASIKAHLMKKLQGILVSLQSFQTAPYWEHVNSVIQTVSPVLTVQPAKLARRALPPGKTTGNKGEGSGEDGTQLYKLLRPRNHLDISTATQEATHQQLQDLRTPDAAQHAARTPTANHMAVQYNTHHPMAPEVAAASGSHPTVTNPHCSTSGQHRNSRTSVTSDIMRETSKEEHAKRNKEQAVKLREQYETSRMKLVVLARMFEYEQKQAQRLEEKREQIRSSRERAFALAVNHFYSIHVPVFHPSSNTTSSLKLKELMGTSGTTSTAPSDFLSHTTKSNTQPGPLLGSASTFLQYKGGSGATTTTSERSTRVRGGRPSTHSGVNSTVKLPDPPIPLVPMLPAHGLYPYHKAFVVIHSLMNEQGVTTGVTLGLPSASTVGNSTNKAAEKGTVHRTRFSPPASPQLPYGTVPITISNAPLHPPASPIKQKISPKPPSNNNRAVCRPQDRNLPID